MHRLGQIQVVQTPVRSLVRGPHVFYMAQQMQGRGVGEGSSCLGSSPLFYGRSHHSCGGCVHALLYWADGVHQETSKKQLPALVLTRVILGNV